MTSSAASVVRASSEIAGTAGAIASFRVDISDTDIQNLHRRLRDTRWPASLVGDGDWSRGVPVDYLQRLAGQWAEFDWRAAEQRLNAHPQFTTEIDGQNIHFLHIVSPEASATPLVLVHGWPSTGFDFLDVIGPLTDPRSHGGDPDQAFHLVIPTLPGFGFSGPTHDAGWNSTRAATAIAELMRRLLRPVRCAGRRLGRVRRDRPRPCRRRAPRRRARERRDLRIHPVR